MIEIREVRSEKENAGYTLFCDSCEALLGTEVQISYNAFKGNRIQKKAANERIEKFLNTHENCEAQK